MSTTYKAIVVSRELAETLEALKQYEKESYSDVIKRLIGKKAR